MSLVQRFASFPRTAFTALFLGSLALAAGCHGMGSTAETPTGNAMLITAGNGTSYVFYPTADKKDVVMMSTNGKPDTCAQCKADAVKAFNGETLAPICDKCGASRTLLSMPK